LRSICHERARFCVYIQRMTSHERVILQTNTRAQNDIKCWCKVTINRSGNIAINRERAPIATMKSVHVIENLWFLLLWKNWQLSLRELIRFARAK
jgi:hypothetical protein